jgi:hypothetical protein
MIRCFLSWDEKWRRILSVMFAGYGAWSFALAGCSHGHWGQPGSVRQRSGRRYGDLHGFGGWSATHSPAPAGTSPRCTEFTCAGADRSTRAMHSDDAGFVAYPQDGRLALCAASQSEIPASDRKRTGRQRRDRRRSGVRVELSDRDGLLLRSLARFRLARTGDLVNLVFQGARRDTATSRLRRLFDAGYLNVKFRDRSEENIYTLGPRGRAWLKDQNIPVGRIPRGDNAHHLAVVHSWVGLAVAAQGDKTFTIERALPDWEIRERVDAVAASIIPDLVVKGSIGTENGDPQHVHIAVEVDLDTEPMSILAGKIAMYEIQRTDDGLFGCRDFGLVIRLVGATSRRREGVEQLLGERWGSWSIVWCDTDTPAGVLDRVTRAISGSPYGLPLRQGMASKPK